MNGNTAGPDPLPAAFSRRRLMQVAPESAAMVMASALLIRITGDEGLVGRQRLLSRYAGFDGPSLAAATVTGPASPPIDAGSLPPCNTPVWFRRFFRPGWAAHETSTARTCSSSRRDSSVMS